MIRKLLYYLQGYVKLKITGVSPERFFNLCKYHKIHIWGVTYDGDSYEMFMMLRDVSKLKPLARKTHMKIKFIGKHGFPFFLFRYRRRKLFFVSAMLALCLLWGYSVHIWDIRFVGNDKWTDQVLLKYLEEQDVEPGIRKEKVDCAMIAAALREKYNDIVWVSASIEGSSLKIQIKENDDTFQQENATANEMEKKDGNQIKSAFDEEESPCDLIASADGVITDMITRNGTPQVHVGDSVKKGDLLVSGRIEVKNDAAEVIGYQYCQADADVLADTKIAYYDSIENTYYVKNYSKQEERRKWYALIGGYKISLGTEYNQTKLQTEYIRQEIRLKLGENFYLPVSLGVIQMKPYKKIEKTYTDEEIQIQLSEKFAIFSQELEKKGIQIRENSVKINCYENYASAQGTLYLNQSITQSAETEIIEIERNEVNEFSGTAN